MGPLRAIGGHLGRAGVWTCRFHDLGPMSGSRISGSGVWASRRRGQLGIVRLVSCLARLASRFSLSVLLGFLPAGRCGDLSGMVVPFVLSITWCHRWSGPCGVGAGLRGGWRHSASSALRVEVFGMNGEARLVDHFGWPASRPDLDRDVVGARCGMDHGDAAWDEGLAGLGVIVHEYVVTDSEGVPLDPVHVGPSWCSTCVVGVRCRPGKSVSLQFGQAHQSRSSIGWVSAGIGNRSLHRPHWRVGATSSGVRPALVVVSIVSAVSVMAPRCSDSCAAGSMVTWRQSRWLRSGGRLRRS